MNFFMIVYNTTKMSSELVLFEAVAAGAIETLFDRENKPWFKRAGLGRYLGILDIARNFKGIKTTSRLEIMGQGQAPTPIRHARRRYKSA